MDNDFKEFKEYIFKHLDKRYSINGNTIICKDMNPTRYIQNMFDIPFWGHIFDKWRKNRVGNTYGVIYPDGYKEWFKDGMYHREDGPAVIHPDGQKEWYQNDCLHRLDGPAVIYSNGYKEWFINGFRYNEVKFKDEVKLWKAT